MIAKKSPLKGMKLGAAATVIIRELPGLHTLDLRVEPGTPAQTAIAELLGFELPDKTGKSQSVTVFDKDDEAYALCLAPDWWLLVNIQEAKDKLTSLKNKDDYHFSVVNVSGQRTTIELEGPNARDVLAHLWEQDLRDKSFPVSSVSQGLIAKAPVILFRIAPLRYRIMVRSSFALHLWQALADAAEEWM